MMHKTQLVGYLRFFRIDSASIAMVYALLGFLLRGGRLISLGGAEWLLFGLIFHVAGFGDNNIQDFRHDAKDENKEPFPLGKSISLETAKKAVLLLHFVGVCYAVYLSGLGPSLLLFAVSYVSGLLYNRLNKRSLASPLLYSLSFSLIGTFSFYATAGADAANALILIMTSIAFLECLFQNAVTTSIKDVQYDQNNIMKLLGVGVIQENLVVTRRAVAFGIGLKTLELVPLALLFFGRHPFTPVSLPVVVSLLLIAFASTLRLLKGGPWERRSRFMLDGAITQLGVFYSVVVILSVEIGVVESVLLVSFPPAWYILMKKGIWGSVLKIVA